MIAGPLMETRPAASTGRAHNIFHHDFTGDTPRDETSSPSYAPAPLHEVQR